MITPWAYLLLLLQILNSLYVYFYILFIKNPVYFMHASNNNYLPIIYFNPILLPKIQFKSRMQEIVIICYNPILLLKVQFQSCMQEIVIIYHEYTSIKYSESSIRINLLLSLFSYYLYYHLLFPVTIYYLP